MTQNVSVILKLEGGLGNQLFEFAAGFYLASKMGTGLVLDQYVIPLSTVHGERQCEIEQFEIPFLRSGKKIEISQALPSEWGSYLAKNSKLIKRILVKYRMFTSNPQKLELFVEQNDVLCTQEFLNLNSPVKLHGNFQSWKIVDLACRYGFPKVLNLHHQPQWIDELKSQIDFKKSVAIHFRLGDDTKANSNFRQPTLDYYVKAFELLKEKRNPHKVFILSDDLNRAREMIEASSFQISANYLEMPLQSSPAERLYLLSLFGGIVCANSTFCGWAAWSIHNSGGDVVVPVPYSDGEVLGSRDFPQTWIQLDKYSGELIG